MPKFSTVDIKIIAEHEKNTIKIPTPAEADHAQLEIVYIIQNQTQAGRTGCILVGKTQSGKQVVMRATANIITAIGAAANGASQRFGDTN